MLVGGPARHSQVDRTRARAAGPPARARLAPRVSPHCLESHLWPDRAWGPRWSARRTSHHRESRPGHFLTCSPPHHEACLCRYAFVSDSEYPTFTANVKEILTTER